MDEIHFANLSDFHTILGELCEKGLGNLPAQILIVPDGTLQAIAGESGYRGKPALLIDLPVSGSPRTPVSITSTRGLGDPRPSQTGEG